MAVHRSNNPLSRVGLIIEFYVGVHIWQNMSKKSVTKHGCRYRLCQGDLLDLSLPGVNKDGRSVF